MTPLIFTLLEVLGGLAVAAGFIALSVHQDRKAAK